MNTFIGLAAICALGTAALPAFAQETSHTFRVGSTELTVKLPKGFCRPRGPEVGFAEAQAKLDTDSVQHLMLLPCEASGDDNSFFLITTPKALIARTMSRPAIIDLMVRNSGSPERIEREREAGLSAVAKEKVEIEAGLGPRGQDATCAYVGGIITYESGNIGLVSLANGGCWTSVGGRVLSINRYLTSGDPAIVKSLMSEVRDLASAISSREVE